jgi:hypothetical protein
MKEPEFGILLGQIPQLHQKPGAIHAGLGMGCSHPNRYISGADLGDKVSPELSKQMQFTEGIEIMPSIQVGRTPRSIRRSPYCRRGQPFLSVAPFSSSTC